MRVGRMEVQLHSFLTLTPDVNARPGLSEPNRSNVTAKPTRYANTCYIRLLRCG